MLEDNQQLKNRRQSAITNLLNLCGAWSAVFSPVVIFITACVIPFGNAYTRSDILKLITTQSGKFFLFLMISLPIWWALQRILDTLHHFNIYPKREKLLIHFLAIAWTLHAGYILFVQ